MKEIHQALMSLGPLIATTVFSLRAKEKQELCSIDLQESERRQAADTINNNDPICGVKREENLRMSHPKDTEADICLRKQEEPVSIFIDPSGEEVEESNTETHPETGQEIISLFIKDEEETYCIYRPESKRRKGSGSPADEGARNMKKRPMYSVASSEKTVCSPLPVDTKVKTFNNPGIRIDTSSPVQQGNNHVLGQDNSAVSLSVEMLPEHSEFDQSPTNVQRSEKCNDFASSLWNANLLKSQPNSQISLNPSACSESETFFRTKHQRTNAVERPYHCIECEKSFILRHHLIQHQRTHTGERPYQCTECHKRFSLKGNLNKHQKTHIITFENTQFRGSVHMGNPILEKNPLNNLININHVEKF